jgi:hypothetical protein
LSEHGSTKSAEKTVFQGPFVPGTTLEAIVRSGKKETLAATFDLKALSDEIKKDDADSSINWWVDIAYDKVTMSRMDDVIVHFGLSDDKKFVSRFSNFRTALPPDENVRLFCHEGNDKGVDPHMTLFAQSMWIKDIPLIHHLPSWLDSAFWSQNAFGKWISTRFVERYSFLLNLSWLSDTKLDEKRSAYKNAETLASVSIYDITLYCSILDHIIS